MAGRQEVELDARCDGYFAVESDRLQLHQGARGIVARIQRQSRVMLRVPLPICLACILFLDVCGIGQHHRTQILRAWRAEDTAAKSIRDEPRQIAAMVEMGVREDNRVDAAGGKRQRLPVAFPQFLQALEEPAVDEDAHAGGVKEVFRAGYCAGGAEEGQGRHP